MSEFTVNLSGLNFITNNRYSSNAYMTVIDISIYDSSTSTNYSTFTFSKTEQAILQIELKDIDTDTLEIDENNVLVDNIVFVFQIKPKRKSALKLYPANINMPLANLTLKTTDIDNDIDLAHYFEATINNNIGTISNNRWSYMWNNVSIKDIVGIENWNKYKKFNIGLVQLAIAGGGDDTVNNLYPFVVEMRGLPFTSSYDIKTRSNSGKVAITTFEYIFNNNAQIYPSSNIQYFTFNKIESANITIDIKNIDTDDYWDSADDTELMGHSTWLFQIIPVEDDF